MEYIIEYKREQMRKNAIELKNRMETSKQEGLRNLSHRGR
jgi:hypothetical protein